MVSKSPPTDVPVTFVESAAHSGAVAPEMPEFLYNEEIELDLDELIEGVLISLNKN
jgi:hypothetical protein